MADDGTDLLTNSLSFYYVSDEVWGDVTAQIAENAGAHLQMVPSGQDPYTAAGIAGTWLGSANAQITFLYIVGHGSPGSVTLGQNITSANAAPLAGWLSSFMSSFAVVRILGCGSAADATQTIGTDASGRALERGQVNPVDQVGIPHVGHELLFALANSCQRKVEGAIDGQAKSPLGLQGNCRRVFPNGSEEVFTP
jgi:hypothetical protein